MASAREVGYHSLSFGQIGLASDRGDPFSLNRVAVKHTTHQEEFAVLLRFERRTMWRLRWQQLVRSFARKTLGPDAYLRVRRLLTVRGATP
jgi:hypothetical protein